MAALAQFLVLFLLVRGFLLMLDGDRRASEDRLREEWRKERLRQECASPEYQRICAAVALDKARQAKEDAERQKAEHEYDERQWAISREVWRQEDEKSHGRAFFPYALIFSKRPSPPPAPSLIG